jgi:hypothetical protein
MDGTAFVVRAAFSLRRFVGGLLLTNNQFHQSRPTKQIRIDREQHTHISRYSQLRPDFAILQSLADAAFCQYFI